MVPKAVTIVTGKEDALPGSTALKKPGCVTYERR
jgi:hypothetical protein